MAEVRTRFELKQGLDPIFRTNDGADCGHGIDTDTLDGRRKAYSLLNGRGPIRLTISVPANADFDVLSVAGLNDELTLPALPGTCGTCHDSPNIGNHSGSALLNIGAGDVASPLDIS